MTQSIAAGLTTRGVILAWVSVCGSVIGHPRAGPLRLLRSPWLASRENWEEQAVRGPPLAVRECVAKD
ncbi:hypothetical protein GCM10014719_67430 [Planomonospora parontospora subsp. antibiotica]|nr:hypothetical protein GCM10014719_67430 [Planomonospora parontospora subsp. antibiotica]GII19933.1 hypothetical protein Ppa05_66590 [Planomonospora parontospora subsp. antibiotica]